MLGVMLLIRLVIMDGGPKFDFMISLGAFKRMKGSWVFTTRAYQLAESLAKAILSLSE
jgi:hypothetical protein